MGRRPRADSHMETRNKNRIMTDRVESSRHMGTTIVKAGPRKRLRGLNSGTQEDGSDRNIHLGPSILSKVVAVSV
jgi:hypothetical protein